ncbi:MAG: hypothetical protein ACOYXT_29060 [Bacteroidota bacterium]
MKTLHTIAILLACCTTLCGQNLFDLYTMLPDGAAMGDKTVRAQMIKDHKAGVSDLNKVPYRFETVDEKNGFLSITGAFEGSWEMCYWNLGGDKLIAVYEQSCGPVCGVEKFNFYLLKGEKLTPQNTEVIIPGYKTIYNDFLLRNAEQTKKELEASDITATLLFKIPRQGKNILALFGNEDSDETYAKYSKGNRMVLKWANGKFVKDKIYWEKQ